MERYATLAGFVTTDKVRGVASVTPDRESLRDCRSMDRGFLRGRGRFGRCGLFFDGDASWQPQESEADENEWKMFHK